MHVRFAAVKDIPLLVSLARAFFHECPVYASSGKDFSAPRVALYLEKAIADPLFAVMIAEDAGYCVGVMTAFIQPSDCFEGLEAFEDYLFVLEAARQQGAGAALLDAYEAWAAKFDPLQLNVNVRAVGDRSQAQTLVDAHGYSQIGVMYAKRGG